MSFKHRIQLMLVALLCRDAALAWVTIGQHARARRILAQSKQKGKNEWR